MFSLLLLAFSAFLVSLVLTPLCRNFFLRLGWVDHPDERRKVHAGPVPSAGGLPIMLAYAAAFGVLLLSPLQGGLLVQRSLPLVWSLVPAVLVILATGLLDDLRGLKPWEKLAGQLAAAGIAYWGGVRIHVLRDHPLQDWLSLLLTLLWLVACANAFNLIDGVDGLAAGIGLFATSTTLLAALLQENFTLAAATAPLAGALLAFLRYNFSPASIFLGDSGSLSIGFLLGCCSVIWSQKSATLLGMTAPLMALAIPLLDTGLAIVRRVLRGQPVFRGDRGHIHHRLLARGLTPRRVALVLYGVCGVGAGFSLVQSVAARQYAGLIVVLFCGAVWIGIHRLGYIEFGLARRLMLPSTFFRILNAQLRLRALEETLAASTTIDQCWLALRAAAGDFGFSRVSLCLDHTVYEESLSGSASGEGWTLRIPLSPTEYVLLGRDFDSSVEPLVVAPLADLLRRALQPKLALVVAAQEADPWIA